MCISFTTLDPADPAFRQLNVIVEWMNRLGGFVHAVRDSVELASHEDEQLATRLYVCDYVQEELRRIAETLDGLVDRWRGTEGSAGQSHHPAFSHPLPEGEG